MMSRMVWLLAVLIVTSPLAAVDEQGCRIALDIPIDDPNWEFVNSGQVQTYNLYQLDRRVLVKFSVVHLENPRHLTLEDIPTHYADFLPGVTITGTNPIRSIRGLPVFWMSGRAPTGDGNSYLMEIIFVSDGNDLFLITAIVRDLYGHLVDNLIRPFLGTLHRGP